MDNRSIYQEIFQQIRDKVISAKISAARKVNMELLNLYWEIGRIIVERQQTLGWGKSVVEQLSSDLQKSFPGNSYGFSSRNLWDMKRLYERYANDEKLRQLVAEIPWGHHLLILNKIKENEEALFYINSCISLGWSRKLLLNQIKTEAYQRSLTDKKQSNFEMALPIHMSEQASEILKSSYSLGFLGINQPILERELEEKLLHKVKDLILELGYGFAFIGNQYKLTLGKKDYYIDLLFYHRQLQCLVAIELKIGEFEPEYAAKLNFYLELLDENVKLDNENPSIGILLCAEKDELEVEYALRVVNKPIGVAEYTFTKELPQNLAKYLPDKESLNRN